MLTLALLYILIIYTVEDEFNQPFLLLGLILVLHFLVLLLLGNYMLKAVLFPYANYFIQKRLDSSINKRFAIEFGKLLEVLYKAIRIMAELDTLDSFKNDKKRKNSKKNTVSQNISQSNDSESSKKNNDKTKLYEEIN